MRLLAGAQWSAALERTIRDKLPAGCEVDGKPRINGGRCGEGKAFGRQHLFDNRRRASNLHAALIASGLAEKPGHTHQIFLINLYLGWTVIGWVTALQWASDRLLWNHAPQPPLNFERAEAPARRLSLSASHSRATLKGSL